MEVKTVVLDIWDDKDRLGHRLLNSAELTEAIYEWLIKYHYDVDEKIEVRIDEIAIW